MNFLHALLFGYACRRTKKENFLLVQPSVLGRAVSEVLVAAYDFNHVSIMLGLPIKLNFPANVTLSAKRDPHGFISPSSQGVP
jgi:hypothetical protein